jgi:hypothetical protein
MSKVKRPFWNIVAPIWETLRYVDCKAIFPLFHPMFGEEFALFAVESFYEDES